QTLGVEAVGPIVLKDGGIVHYRVDPPEADDGFRKQPACIGLDIQIGLNEAVTPPKGVEQAQGVLRIFGRAAVVNRDVPAFFCQSARDMPPDTMCRPGDQGHTPEFRLSHGVLLAPRRPLAAAGTRSRRVPSA